MIAATTIAVALAAAKRKNAPRSRGILVVGLTWCRLPGTGFLDGLSGRGTHFVFTKLIKQPRHVPYRDMCFFLIISPFH